MCDNIENYTTRLELVAKEGLISIQNQYPNAYFYFFEPEYWLYFYDVSNKFKLGINVLEITLDVMIKKRSGNQSPKVCLAPEDTIVYVGRPYQLLRYLNHPNVKSRVNPIVFVSIPLYSHTLKFDVWKRSVDFSSFNSLCFPFLPFRHFLQLSIGSFKNIFLGAPLFETKALKAALSSLAYLYGRFDRVYAIGSFSSEISKGFLDNCQPQDSQSGRNNLILFDRTIDILSLMIINNSYIGLAEELEIWDPMDDRIRNRALAGILNVPENQVAKYPIYTENDPLFPKLSLLNLEEALRNVRMSDIRNCTTENLVQDHTILLNWLNQEIKRQYFVDLSLKIMKGLVNAEQDGRCIAINPFGPSLAFRVLSVLHHHKIGTAKPLARLLAARFGLTMFSKWNQIDSICLKTPFVKPPEKIRVVNQQIGTIASLLGIILTDEWKRPNFPMNDSYVSSSTALSNEKRRWFVGVIGGMTSTELKIFKQIAKICRPNDEFVFMSTEIISGRKFMESVLF